LAAKPYWRPHANNVGPANFSSDRVGVLAFRATHRADHQRYLVWTNYLSATTRTGAIVHPVNRTASPVSKPQRLLGRAMHAIDHSIGFGP